MKILCLCDHGNNRSVHFAHQLKYWDHDVIAAGLDKNSAVTLSMLYAWADVIIITAEFQREKLPKYYRDDPKVKLFSVGPDIYPRPFNPILLELVKKILKENESWLKPKTK